MAELKVAQLLYSGLGGHASVAFSLVDGLIAKKYRFIMGFLGIEPIVPSYENYCQGKVIDFNYFRATAGKPIYTWPRVLFWLFKKNPDLLILHSVKSIIPCMIFSAFSRKPLVFVEHQPIQLRGKSDLICSYLGMKFSKKVVYLSNDYSDAMRKILGKTFDSEKIEIIPNGIDVDKFSPKGSVDLKKDRIVFGMAARFADTRRQDVLVETVEKLLEEAPQVNWHLTLAGNGTTFGRIEKLVQDRGLSQNVTLAGHLDEAELIKWFHDLDIYVHATEGETLSTSMLQAMACGIPMVASNVPGVSNLLQHGNSLGVLVDEQRPSSFCSAILALVSDPERTFRMVQNATRVVQDKFSNYAMAKHYAKVIDEIILRAPR